MTKEQIKLRSEAHHWVIGREARGDYGRDCTGNRGLERVDGYGCSAPVPRVLGDRGGCRWCRLLGSRRHALTGAHVEHSGADGSAGR